MNKLILLSIAILSFLLISTTESHAQKKKKQSDVEEYFDESGGWAHRLWFGGSVNPGFQSDGFQSVFFFGISPMMGIKVFEDNNNFSIGPRVNFEYTYRKFRTNNSSLQNVSYSVGAFARYKVFSQFFPHVEIEYENRGIPDFSTNPVSTERETRQNFYVGAGYNSGGLLGYEIVILYNVLEPEDSFETPFDIRVGLTYKF